MHHRRLHDALQSFAEEASAWLAAETASGAEVPFEVIERGGGHGRRTPLYCYRPQTAEFIRDRLGGIAGLASFAPAVRALMGFGGAEAYLRARGHTRPVPTARERGEAALCAFLDRLFAEASDFTLTEERFTRTFEELAATAAAGLATVEVLAPVWGIELASPEVDLGGGVVLVRGDALDDGPEPDAPAPVLVLASEPGDGGALEVLRIRVERVALALALYDAGGAALGPVGWTRAGDGPWSALAVGRGGRVGAGWLLTEAMEDELRAFCSLVGRRMPRSGELAWALRRWTAAAERPPPEALSDVLLTLRALLEPEGAASGRLAPRLAALCAPEGGREALAERVAHAATLERAVIAGTVSSEPALAALVEELGGHARALLRDVLCGHLDPDLRRVADDLLAAAAPSGTPDPATG